MSEVVPAAAFTVAGKSPGAGGCVFLAGADNTTIDVSLDVDPLWNDVWASLEVTPVTARILWLNDPDTPGVPRDITDQTVTNVVVGQKIHLKLVPDNAIGQPDAYAWTIGEKYFRDYNPSTAADGYSGPENVATNAEETVFYWVTGGSKEIECKVEKDGEEFEAATAFSVIRPDADFRADRLSVVTSNYGWLTLGTPVVVNGVLTNSPEGMKFTAENFDLKEWTGSGHWGFLQILNTNVFDFDFIAPHTPAALKLTSHGLDKWVEMPMMAGGVPPKIFTYYSPAFQVNSTMRQVRRNSAFQIYLMFAPTNSPGYKSVPIKRIDWDFSVTSYKISDDPQENLWFFVPLQQTFPPTTQNGLDDDNHPRWSTYGESYTQQNFTNWIIGPSQ